MYSIYLSSIPRKPIFSRCLPDVSSTAEALLGSLGIDDVLTDIVADIKISWREILYMSLIALGDLTRAKSRHGFLKYMLHRS